MDVEGGSSGGGLLAPVSRSSSELASAPEIESGEENRNFTATLLFLERRFIRCRFLLINVLNSLVL